MIRLLGSKEVVEAVASGGKYAVMGVLAVVSG